MIILTGSVGSVLRFLLRAMSFPLSIFARLDLANISGSGSLPDSDG